LAPYAECKYARTYSFAEHGTTQAIYHVGFRFAACCDGDFS